LAPAYGVGNPMESLSSRSCIIEDDQERIVDLLLAYRNVTGVHVYQTAWRLRLLWTSRVGDLARDVRVWEDATGRAVGFAMLWRRRPDNAYLVLDRLVHPACVTDHLADALLEWGAQRAYAIATEQAVPLTLYAGAFDPAVCHDTGLESQGFAPVPPDPHKYDAYFARSLQAALPVATLPAGYTIRHLHGIDEMEGYQALYDFTPVDPHHRQALLNSDTYSHLVAVGPDGSFAAYCECSVWRAEWQKSGQRIGWLDYMGTSPERRRRGLGQAILLAGLARLRAWGADTAMLVTVSTNVPAVRLYESVGFARVDVSEAPRYQKQVPAARKRR